METLKGLVISWRRYNKLGKAFFDVLSTISAFSSCSWTFRCQISDDICRLLFFFNKLLLEKKFIRKLEILNVTQRRSWWDGSYELSRLIWIYAICKSLLLSPVAVKEWRGGERLNCLLHFQNSLLFLNMRFIRSWIRNWILKDLMCPKLYISFIRHCAIKFCVNKFKQLKAYCLSFLY